MILPLGSLPSESEDELAPFSAHFPVSNVSVHTFQQWRASGGGMSAKAVDLSPAGRGRERSERVKGNRKHRKCDSSDSDKPQKPSLPAAGGPAGLAATGALVCGADAAA